MRGRRRRAAQIADERLVLATSGGNEAHRRFAALALGAHSVGSSPPTRYLACLAQGTLA